MLFQKYFARQLVLDHQKFRYVYNVLNFLRFRFVYNVLNEKNLKKESLLHKLRSKVLYELTSYQEKTINRIAQSFPLIFIKIYHWQEFQARPTALCKWTCTMLQWWLDIQYPLNPESVNLFIWTEGDRQMSCFVIRQPNEIVSIFFTHWQTIIWRTGKESTFGSWLFWGT